MVTLYGDVVGEGVAVKDDVDFLLGHDFVSPDIISAKLGFDAVDGDFGRGGEPDILYGLGNNNATEVVVFGRDELSGHEE